MKPLLPFLLLLGVVSLPLASRSEETTQAGIAALGEAYAAAFNKGDAKAVAAFWLPDGDYVDQFGNRYVGRAEIEKLFTAFFAENKGVQLRIDSEALRSITTDLAIEDGTSLVSMPDAPLPSRARFTNALTRKDGTWFLASVRESAFAPPDRSAELGPMSGLLGEWKAIAKSGETIFLSVAPAPGGNFLIMQRTIVLGDGPVAGGTEWIAWDPAKKQIRSWSFDADGGFGESVWKPSASGWTVESQHTLRDGTLISEKQNIASDPMTGLTVNIESTSANNKDLPKPEPLLFTRPNQN